MASSPTKTLGTFQTPPIASPSLSPVNNNNQPDISNMSSGSKDPQLPGTPKVPSPLNFSAIVKSTIAEPRSEISLLLPGQAPPVFQAGTFPHSVFYTLSADLNHSQLPFHKAIRKQFPRDVGLGLNITQATTNEISIEVSLCDEDSCTSALAQPISIPTKDQEIRFHASPAVTASKGL
ncbi:hypothetical protein ABG067_007995, partial [Albugo candida]